MLFKEVFEFWKTPLDLTLDLFHSGGHLILPSLVSPDELSPMFGRYSRNLVTDVECGAKRKRYLNLMNNSFFNASNTETQYSSIPSFHHSNGERS
jgi:hypothetical protein